MTGNATEEWLMTRLDYPGHMDAGRFAGLSGATAAITAGLTVNEFAPPALATVAGMGAGLLVGALVHRRLTRRAMAREVERRAAARAAQERDTKAQIALMKANTVGAQTPQDEMKKG